MLTAQSEIAQIGQDAIALNGIYRALAAFYHFTVLSNRCGDSVAFANGGEYFQFNGVLIASVSSQAKKRSGVGC